MRSERKKLEHAQEKRFLKGGGAKGGGTLLEGSPAQLAGTEIVGIIESLGPSKAVLRAGAMRMEVDVKKLLPTDKKPKDAVARPETITSPGDRVPPSIMVRGMNIQEAVPAVERYLDQAMRMGYDQVTVIHGLGEGVLRREVHSLCKKLKYVDSYRLGDGSEGGYGVTIVTFKK